MVVRVSKICHAVSFIEILVESHFLPLKGHRFFVVNFEKHMDSLVPNHLIGGGSIAG